MREIIENEVRERVCEENFHRMQTVKSNLKKARIYNIYFTLFVTLCSWGALFIWITHTGTEMKRSIQVLEEEAGEVLFPWYAVTALLCPLLAAFGFLADNTLKRVFSILGWFIHFTIVLFAGLNLFLRFEPMETGGLLILLVYGALGMWSQDFALRSYKELDYLSTQEGYPDFNFNLEAGRYSKYVKYRNSWLKKQKKLDYYTPAEQPVDKPITVRTESETQMEGISLSESDKSQWFDQMENIASEQKPASEVIFDPVTNPECADVEILKEMEEVETEGEGMIAKEAADDYRHRPL